MKREIYKARQHELICQIASTAQLEKPGVVLLIGAFEQERYKFSQDSTFYYYTGIEEPGVLCLIEDTCRLTLYIPQYKEKREKWVSRALEIDNCSINYAVDYIEYLGEPCHGYQVTPLFSTAEYATLIKKLAEYTKNNIAIYTTYPQTKAEYIQQRLVLDRLTKVVRGLENSLVDISPVIARMRRKKSREEIEQLYTAVHITMTAQEAVAHALEVGKKESDLEAVINFIFTENNASVAFPSIVAAGENSTVLHYTKNSAVIKKNDLVVVDIGARYNYYCADITRTYPASGKFSKRQAKIYELVLQTQEYIASVAQPGYWLSNKEHPDKSLHHLAVQFLKERGYAEYFTHGIGHFLGLDVHDVGDRAEPLQEGDVITIEPGIYIPEESVGIRIEDNYWIVKGGAVCLSEDLHKDIHTIEKVVQEKPQFKNTP